MTKQIREIPKKTPEVDPPKPKQLSELTDAQLLMAIYQQQDTVHRLRQQLAQEENRLMVIDAEGRKRAKPITEKEEIKK